MLLVVVEIKFSAGERESRVADLVSYLSEVFLRLRGTNGIIKYVMRIKTALKFSS